MLWDGWGHGGGEEARGGRPRAAWGIPSASAARAFSAAAMLCWNSGEEVSAHCRRTSRSFRAIGESRILPRVPSRRGGGGHCVGKARGDTITPPTTARKR